MRFLGALVLTGCSFATMTRPPPAAELVNATAVGCSSSFLWPVLDTLGGVNLLAGGAQISSSSKDDQSAAMIFGWPMVMVGAVQLLAAAYGYTTAAQCRSARAEVDRRNGRVEPPAPPRPVYCEYDRDCDLLGLCMAGVCRYR